MMLIKKTILALISVLVLLVSCENVNLSKDCSEEDTARAEEIAGSSDGSSTRLYTRVILAENTFTSGKRRMKIELSDYPNIYVKHRYYITVWNYRKLLGKWRSYGTPTTINLARYSYEDADGNLVEVPKNETLNLGMDISKYTHCFLFGDMILKRLYVRGTNRGIGANWVEIDYGADS